MLRVVVPDLVPVLNGVQGVGPVGVGVCPISIGKVETGVSNRGQDRTVLGEKCKLSFQFRVSLASSPGARLEPLGHLSGKS